MQAAKKRPAETANDTVQPAKQAKQAAAASKQPQKQPQSQKPAPGSGTPGGNSVGEQSWANDIKAHLQCAPNAEQLCIAIHLDLPAAGHVDPNALAAILLADHLCGLARLHMTCAACVYGRRNGASKLAALGSSVPKPAGIPKTTKMKKFLELRPDTFAVDPDTQIVTLKH